jgi:hypothetical protein
MLTDLYTGSIEEFKPVKAIDGYRNIRSARWGTHDRCIDVTDIFWNKKDTSRLCVDYRLFPYDPAPGSVKYLDITYTDGTTQRVEEYTYTTLLT